MDHASLFSGIGGFDFAAEIVGFNNVFHCEWNNFARRILKYYWTNAESYGDITKTDFTIYKRRIDILTGGFPCQPYSLSGKRLGKKDDRHLWPEMLRAVREIQAPYVIGENVTGIISWSGGVVFEEVCNDLENEGYEVQSFVLPACAKDAPHRRDRVWFVAYSASARAENLQWQKENGISKSRNVTNTNGFGLRRESYRQGKSGLIGEKGKMLNWQNFPTQSPVCDGNDGISTRLDVEAIYETIGKKITKAFNPRNWWIKESIKGGGNAIVPHIAIEIFKAIIEHANSEQKS